MEDLQPLAYLGPILLVDKAMAAFLQWRFQNHSNPVDLDGAITYSHQILGVCPAEHPNMSSLLFNLAQALQTRFGEQGDMRDLDKAIIYYKQALEQAPPGHPNLSASLNNLPSALIIRFSHQGNMGDLDQAISYFQKALGLLPAGHPGQPVLLGNLAVALSTQFDHQGDMRRLDQAIIYHQHALDLCPYGHPDHSASLNNLAGALRTRFSQQGDMVDLDQAITYFQQALYLHPSCHPNYPAVLSNLAVALRTRFGQQGDMGDLDQAISYHQQALNHHPPGHPDHSASLSNLAVAFSTRFNQQGDIADLDQATTYFQQALDLYPTGHPNRPAFLSNLAVALSTHFNQQGDMGDLDQAITYHQQALNHHPPGHPDWSASLNNLANVLRTRFDQQGDMKDLDQAITYLQQSLHLHPSGHPEHSASLNNLAGALRTWSHQQGDMGNLDQAITYLQQALDLHPPGHQKPFTSLNNLANALRTKFDHQGNMEDLDQAVTYYQQALNLCPVGHSEHSTCLSNLAVALRTRFDQQGDMCDLDRAIHLYEQAHDIPSYHPHQLRLAYCLAAVYLQHPEAKHLVDKSFSLLQQAVTQVSAGSKAQLLASLDWIKLARKHSHRSELLAFTTALGLVQKYITLHATIQSQLSALAWVPLSLGSGAAACAIQQNQLDTALELLEQGRAVLWRTVGGYRNNVEELTEAGHLKLAQEFQRLGNLLEHSTLSPMETTQRSGQSLAEEAQRYHQITKDWEHVIKQIQQIDGFTHFLKATPFHTLQMSASHGPVITVNISQYHSDAIILSNGHDPIHVPLPSATLEAIILLAQNLQHSLGSDNPRRCSASVTSVLRSLWDWVVQPIVHNLNWLPQGSHIWWCPTSSLCSLPLHAAGPWKKREKNLPDLFLSSYTPTLSALQRAHTRDSIMPATSSLLVIGVSECVGGSGKLGHVKGELAQIRLATSKCQLVNFLEDDQAVKTPVLTGLQQHSWVHFCCHGQQDFNEPFKSCFRLHDMPLTLHDIIQAQIPNAELAFLSACHTASGVQKRPDEIIHLAAALQFSGFKTVIGTLWAMDDRDGPDVAKAFYEYMFRNGVEKVDHRDAAQALKCVVDTLRRKGVPVHRWANFIHIGA